MIKDDAGDRRETFPHTMYLAAGTQAASPGENGVIVLKLNGVSKGRHGEQAAKPKAEGMDDDESDDASSSCRCTVKAALHLTNCMTNLHHAVGFSTCICAPKACTVRPL